MASALADKQDVISDLATIRSGAAAGATAVQPGDLATVATTGSYDDLSDKPTIPAAQVNADWNAASGVAQILNKPSLATVATTGSYNDLSDKPTINNVPAVTSSDDNKVLKASYSGGVGSYSWETGGAGSQVNADWTEDDPNEASYIENKPVPKALVGGAGITIVETQNSLTISNTAPTPAVDQTYGASSTNAQSGVAVASGISNAVSGAIGDLPSNLTPAQIEAIKVALGIDETELFSGNATGNAPINLSESLFNFERLKIWICSKEDANNPVSIVEVPTSGLSSYLWVYLTDRYNNTWQWITWRFSYAITNSGTTLTEVSNAYGGSNSNSAWSAGLNVYDNHVYKIVGIHRIANN
jgi:hypothetical protein